MSFLLETPAPASRYFADNPEGAGAPRDPAGYLEIEQRAFDAARLTRSTVGSQNATADVIAERIRQIKRETGQELNNPFDLPLGARAALRRSLGDVPLDEAFPSVAARAFDAAVERIVAPRMATGDPRPDWARPIRESARELARTAERSYEDAFNATPGLAKYLAAFSAGTLATLGDPAQLALLAVNPPAGVGETALARIVSAGVGWSLAAGASEAATQPFIQAWRAEAGLPSGVGEALKDIGIAFVGGAVLGTGGRTGLEAVRGFPRTPAARPAPGAPAPDPGQPPPAAESPPIAPDIPRETVVSTAERLRGQLHDEVRGALDELKREREIDASAPPGVDTGEHRVALTQASAFIENPETAPPPIDVVARPLPPKGTEGGEGRAAVAGESWSILGKPVHPERVKPLDVTFNPDVWQYKRGGDARGVTDRLAGVAKWDPAAADEIYTFRWKDGRLDVVDGHQRTGLAQRLTREGDGSIELPARVFNEADGWKPGEVRALAAKRNIQKETGDAIDTATILREVPDIIDRSINVSTPHVRTARALARLSDDAFGAVRAGVVRADVGAAIAEGAPKSPQLHMGLIDAMAKRNVRDPDVARRTAIEASRLGSAEAEAATQGNLFGDLFFEQSLVIERAQILEDALARLVSDEKLFRRLGLKQSDIEAVGNVLDTAANEQRATLAAQAAQILDRLASRTGPVSELLNVGARELADGGKRAPIVQKFLDALLGAVEDRGAVRAAAEIIVPEPSGRPGLAVNAETVATEVELLERQAIVRAPAPEQGAEPSMLDLLPIDTEEGGLRTVKVDELLAEGKRGQELAKLVEGCSGKVTA